MPILRLNFFTKFLSSNFNKTSLVLLINLAILISIFAFTSALISVYYENKINKLIQDNNIREANSRIYVNWISKTPNKVNEISDFLNSRNLRLNYQEILSRIEYSKKLSKNLVNLREKNYEPFFEHKQVINNNVIFINEAIEDALIVTSNSGQLKEIKNIIEQHEKINAESRSIKHKQTLIELDFWNKKESNKNLYYEQFQEFKNETFVVINLQKTLIQSQLIGFFVKNKNIEQKIILENNEEIKKLSKKLSNLILISFLIQILVFLVIQYFEVFLERDEKKN